MNEARWKPKIDAPGWWVSRNPHPEPVGIRYDLEFVTEPNAYPVEDNVAWFGPINYDADNPFAHDALLTENAALRERVRELEEGLNAVARALTNEGICPPHHRATMKRHRKEWPYLWKRLDALLAKEIP